MLTYLFELNLELTPFYFNILDMKFTNSIPKIDKELSNTLQLNGWKKIKEPSTINRATIASFPIMLLNIIVYILFIYKLWSEFASFLQQDHSQITINLISMIWILIGTYIYSLIHELMHLVFIPNFLSSKKTIFGINKAYGFVVSTEMITKKRMLIISGMPLLILSFIIPFIMIYLGIFNWIFFFLGLINAVGSSIDLLNIILITVQVPRGSYVINNVFETYYK